MEYPRIMRNFDVINPGNAFINPQIESPVRSTHVDDVTRGGNIVHVWLLGTIHSQKKASSPRYFLSSSLLRAQESHTLPELRID
jgi:hypothetical protein